MSLPDACTLRVSDLFPSLSFPFFADDDEDDDEDFPILFLSYGLKIFRCATLDLGIRASLPLQLHYGRPPITPMGVEAVESQQPMSSSGAAAAVTREKL